MEEKSLIQIIPILWRNKVTILSTVFITGLLTSAVMLTRPNYYRSTTTFYPANSALHDPAMGIGQHNIEYYGDDRDIDRILTIGNSQEIIDEVIQEFQLSRHYKIDISDNKGKIKLYKKFRKLYNIQKTGFDAVELSVEDKSPEMAQKLTRSLREKVDFKTREIVFGAQADQLKQINRSFTTKRNKLKSLTDSLKVLRIKYNIYDTESQGEALAAMEAKSNNRKYVQSRIDQFNEGVALVTNLETMQEELNEALADDAIIIDQIESAVESKSSSLYIIEEAQIPLEKSRPKRSLYVIGAMTGMGLVSILLVLIREQLSQLS